jgi:hypothetical protein
VSQFDYIAKTYGKTFKRGQKVVALGKPGTVTSATHYVMVRLDGQKATHPYHPDDVNPQNPAHKAQEESNGKM